MIGDPNGITIQQFNNHPQGKQVSLFEAQKFKLDRALDFLGPIREDASVCEIGFGWGSLAHRVYSETQYKYHGITLSAKQLEYVKEKFLYLLKILSLDLFKFTS